MGTSKRFDEIAKRVASETVGELLITGLSTVLILPILTLTRFVRQSTRLVPVTNEDACYAAGGYVVEIQSRPITDWCCVCENANGAICPSAAPKAVFEASDRIGSLRARAVSCLLAGDKPAIGCTATCVPISIRKSYTG